MAEMKHTPEPWFVSQAGNPAGVIIEDRSSNVCAIAATPEDALRIVACVNAMEGIEYPEKWVRELKAENFRLRDVLEELTYHCTTENGIDRSAFDKALDKAEEILKGGNNESR